MKIRKGDFKERVSVRFKGEGKWKEYQLRGSKGKREERLKKKKEEEAEENEVRKK